MKINGEDLKQLTHLDLGNLGNRALSLMPLWDGDGWQMWLPTEKGLLRMRPVDALESEYLAKSPAAPTDIYIPFIDRMWQQANWPDVTQLIVAISEDFRNMGTAVEKTCVFFRARKSIGHAVSHFVATETEYLFMLCRSVFDLLQELIQRIWDQRVQLLDPEAERRRKARKLPTTFSKVVLRDKTVVRPEDEIVSKFELPPEMAQAYAAATPFFMTLRAVRDAIVHSGKRTAAIFVTDRAFCVHKAEPAYSRLPCWSDSHDDGPHLRSLLPLFSHVILGTIATCSILVEGIISVIQMPPPVAPDHHVFVRGPHNAALLWMEEVAAGGSPWWSGRKRRRKPAVRRVTPKEPT